jgi:hypothetical protein
MSIIEGGATVKKKRLGLRSLIEVEMEHRAIW